MTATGMEGEESIRERALRWAYRKYHDAKGISGQVFTITDARAGLKQEGLSSSEVSRAVAFLSQTEYLTEQTATFQTRGGSVLRGTTRYKISYLVIENIEGRSRFTKPEALAGINITELVDVTVMGDGNIVQIAFAPLYGPLDSIENVIRGGQNLTSAQKREAIAELLTIRGQLEKSFPDKETISTAWARLKSFAEKLVAASTFIDLIEQLLRKLFRI